MTYTTGFGYSLQMGDYAMANPTQSEDYIANLFFPRDATHTGSLSEIKNDIYDMRSSWDQNTTSTNKRRLDQLNNWPNQAGPQYSNNNYVYSDPTIPKPKLPEVNEPNPVSPDPVGDPIYPNTVNNNVHGNSIRTMTFIGGQWVSDDVISINTSQVSNADEGNEPSKCTVVLNNNYQKYGKLIASYAWTPKITGIWSMAFVDFNLPNGGYTTSQYMLFQGWMSDAKYTEETATVEFGCVSVLGSDSFDDTNWSPDARYFEKMQEIIGNIEKYSNHQILVADLTTKTPDLLSKQWFSPSDMSATENLRQIAKDNKESFYYATDWEDNVYVVFIDEGSYTEYVYLDPYVINPGDTSTVFGHANELTVIAGSTSDDPTMRHIPTSVKNEVIGVKYNEKSISRYGRTPSYINHSPNLPASQVDFEADIADDNFAQYIDRDIKVDVANKVPKIQAIVIFTVPDILTGEQTYIYGGVKKKQVEFSSAGLISHLECARLNLSIVEEEITGDVVVFISKDDTAGNTWEYQWNYDTQKWDIGVRYEGEGGYLGMVHRYTDPVPPEVSTLIDITSIETKNDAINPKWRTK
jgi:hypothetical protein